MVISPIIVTSARLTSTTILEIFFESGDSETESGKGVDRVSYYYIILETI